MRMIIRYQGGPRVEAMLLAANGGQMRIIVGSQRDTIELNRIDDVWYGAKGPVEIEALIPVPGADISRFCTQVVPRAYAAGCCYMDL